MVRYHLVPVRSLFPFSHQGARSHGVAPHLFPCSMLTLRQDTHCKKMDFAEQNLLGLSLVLMQQLL